MRPPETITRARSPALLKISRSIVKGSGTTVVDVCVMVALCAMVAVAEGDAEGVADGEGLALDVAVLLRVGVPVKVPLGVLDWVRLWLGVGVPLGELEGLE